MKVFKAEHNGRWLGGCSVVVAQTIQEGKQMLDAELEKRGLRDSVDDPFDLIEISLDQESVHMLFDGDY